MAILLVLVELMAINRLDNLNLGVILIFELLLIDKDYTSLYCIFTFDPGLTVTVNLFFTLREPNIYKPHGFFWASSPLLFAFVLLFCFI